MTIVARSVESLRPDSAPPEWAELIGPAADASQVRWHTGLDTLMGFLAPSDCQGLATVGYGWARNLNDAPPSGNALLSPGERRRCRVVFLMMRGGDIAGYLRVGTNILIDEPPTIGRIPDLVRRCLGLPTPPPEESTAGLLARVWLNNIVAAADRAPGPLTWLGVVGLHPVFQAAAKAGITIPSAETIAVLRLAAESWTWSHLTARSAEPGWLADLLPAGAAGWMDEGILSRWLLDTLSPIDTVLARVAPLLTPATAQRLRATLSQLGVN